MLRILAAECNVFFLSMPLGVATESNAQKLMIFNTLYDGIIINKLGTALCGTSGQVQILTIWRMMTFNMAAMKTSLKIDFLIRFWDRLSEIPQNFAWSALSYVGSNLTY